MECIVQPVRAARLDELRCGLVEARQHLKIRIATVPNRGWACDAPPKNRTIAGKKQYHRRSTIDVDIR
jgi:DNA-binding winged helix-turn-helix (wHTH) protein